MADIIKLLPDTVANQIAAGEVNQRPSSVIKELVENSADAGATEKNIEVRDAGRTLIQVTDNGKGMSPTDARMAFERHATSKIRQASDLFALHTMGFRGEALPSISAISQVEVLTAVAGVPMGTRSGDLDAGILQYLMNKYGYSIGEMLNILNKKSGVLGISGISSDDRDVLAAAEAGNKRAALARSIQRYQIRKFIGAYVAAMDGVDAIVFTGGIGEHSPEIRQRVMEGLEYLGVDFDFELNKHPADAHVSVLSKPDSKVKVAIIPTNEELVIARETKELTQNLVK